MFSGSYTSRFENLDTEKRINQYCFLNMFQEEERELLSSLTKNNSRVFKSFRRVAYEEEGRTILQKAPLQRKLAGISWV